jgi:hypothetical protein
MYAAAAGGDTVVPLLERGAGGATDAFWQYFEII